MIYIKDYKSIFLLKLTASQRNLPSKSLVVIYKNVEPNFSKNQNYLLRIQLRFAQGKKYSIFQWDNYPKGWKISGKKKLGSNCLSAHLVD